MTKLIWITPEAEKQIMYIARVSNPNNQDSEDTKLLGYCVKNKHWSPFEMVNMCIEIETSRAISAQILRHKSMNFQEFSQRYSKAQEILIHKARSQDLKNRQNSVDNMSVEDQIWFKETQEVHFQKSQELYEEALRRGIAKEQARFLLPMATKSRLYINGNIRSWIHYIDLRCGNGTQKEHREIAEGCREIFREQFPIVSEALGWNDV